MLTVKEQAEVNRIGLISGLLSRQDVIGWADSIIEAYDSPDSAIIDISLMGSADLPGLVSALYDVTGEAGFDRIIDTVLGLCAQKLRCGSLTADKAGSVLNSLAPDMSCRRCNIRAEYDTLVDHKTAAAIRAALSENAVAAFLAPYAGYAAEISPESADL